MKARIFKCMASCAGFAVVAIAATQAPVPGDQLAPFSLPDDAGTVHSWRPGKPAVVCVIAYWCSTWKTQFQRLAEARRLMSGFAVDFLLISTDGRWSELGKAAPPGLRLVDRGAQWSAPLGIDRVPYTFVVDEQGQIQWSKFGVVRSLDVANALRNPNAERGDVYLTFDDFPAQKGNLELLDLLRRAQVPATFFCIGQNVQQHPEIVRRAADQGHELQVHSWAHDAVNPRLSECSALLHRLTGQTPTLYRPPGKQELYTLQGQLRKAYTIEPYDYRRPNSNEIYRRIMLNLKSGAIIQLHVGVDETVQLLPKLIAEIRRRGYRLRTLN